MSDIAGGNATGSAGDAEDRSVAARLDARSKLAVQFGLALAAVGRPTPLRLAGLFAVGLATLPAARLPLRRALWSYRYLLAVLAVGPVLAALSPGPPWLRPERGLAALASAARIVPVLLASAAYGRSTSARETRGAVERLVPGRPGRLLGVGLALTLRLVPAVRNDVARARDAVAARGGDRRGVLDRAARLATLSTARALARTDRLTLALRARCLAWNATLPVSSFGRADVGALALAVALALSPLI